MTAPVSLTPRTIGETENALRALLMNALADTELDYPAWVALRLITESKEPMQAASVAARLRDGLKIDAETAAVVLDRLRATGMASPSGDHLLPTTTGASVHERVSSRVRSMTRNMWDGFSAEELAVTQQVLSRITERANALLETKDPASP